MINVFSVGIFEILYYLGLEFFYVGVSIFGLIGKLFDPFSLKWVQLIKYAIYTSFLVLKVYNNTCFVIVEMLRPSVRVCQHETDKFNPKNSFQYFDFYDFITFL